MGCSDGVGVGVANPSEKSSIAPSSVAFDTRFSLASDLLRGAFSHREVALMDARIKAIMKIIIFSIKFDKFTGFFDKLLKIISRLTGCYIKGCSQYLSVVHSDSAAKKVFRLHRICPHLPAFGRGRLGEFGLERTRHEVAHGVPGISALEQYGVNLAAYGHLHAELVREPHRRRRG